MKLAAWIILVAIALAGIAHQEGLRMAGSYAALMIGLPLGVLFLQLAWKVWNLPKN